MVAPMSSVVPGRPESKVEIDAGFTLSKLLLLLGIFVIITFPTVVIGKNSFFYRDMGLFGYPLAHFHREAFWRGEIPFWNPLNNGGLPFFAQWNTMVLYPGSLIYLLLPLPLGMNVFVLAHLFVAAAGMYALARRWTGNRIAASVAGLAFACNGLTLHSLMWPNNIAALAWMPWVVLAMERAWREGGRRTAIAALVGSVQMLAGAPEIILLTWLVIGLLWARDLISGEASSGPRAPIFRRFALSALLIGAVCAVQLFPFLDLLRHSQRGVSFGGATWSMPLWGWSNFLVPMFGCTPSVTGVYSQDAQQWTSSYYLGIGTVAFALLAWRADEGRVKWLAAIALAGLLLALGDAGHIYAWLKRIVPVLGFIRFPIKYVVLVVFALPLLAAFGAKAFLEQSDSGKARRWVNVVFGALLLAGVSILVLDRISPIAGTEPGALIGQVMRPFTFLLLVLGVLSLSRAITFLKPRPAFALVLIFMAADVLWHMPPQNPVVPNRAYGPVEHRMSDVPRLGHGRAMVAPPMQRTISGLAHPDPLTMFTGHREMLTSECNLLDDVPVLHGFFSLYLREADEVTRRLQLSTNYNLPLLDFLGVTQLSDARELFVWHSRSNAMPFVSAGQRAVYAPAQESFEGIFSPVFDPQHTVFLPAELRGIFGDLQPNACRVIRSDVRSERVTADVEASAPSLVVIAQARYEGWKAFVDGQPVPLLPANYAYQAVKVPAGGHRIELRYQERTFRAGLIVSALGLAGCCFIVMRGRRKLMDAEEDPTNEIRNPKEVRTPNSAAHRQ
jgi:hypothetical protein